MGREGPIYIYIHLEQGWLVIGLFLKSLKVVQAADFLSHTPTCYTVVMACVAGLYTVQWWYLCIMLDIVLQQTLVILCS